MRNYYFIPAICILLFCSRHVHAQNTGAFLLKNDFTATSNQNEAVYLLHVIKYDDTNYICRYYNKFGPMIKQEAFLDSNLSIPNGRFLWYDKNGNLDSAAQVYRGHKTEWTYYNDSIIPIIYIKYKNGNIFEKRDHLQNIYMDSVGNIRNLTDVEKEEHEKYEQYQKDSGKYQIPAGFNNNWNKYINKQLGVTNRFKSMPAGQYYITVSFLITKEGKVDQVELLHSIEWSQDLEVLQIFEKSPPWQPAVQNGKNVIYRQRQNLGFTIGEQ
jgi:protein TonB